MERLVSSSEEESEDEDESSSAAETPSPSHHVDLLNLGSSTPTTTSQQPPHTQQQGALFDLMGGSQTSSQQAPAGLDEFSDFSAPTASANNVPSGQTNGNIDLLGGFDSMAPPLTQNTNGGSMLQPGQASSHASSSSLVDQDFMNFMGSQSSTSQSTENILCGFNSAPSADAGMTRPASFANQPHLNNGKLH